MRARSRTGASTATADTGRESEHAPIRRQVEGDRIGLGRQARPGSRPPTSFASTRPRQVPRLPRRRGSRERVAARAWRVEAPNAARRPNSRRRPMRAREQQHGDVAAGDDQHRRRRRPGSVLSGCAYRRRKKDSPWRPSARLSDSFRYSSRYGETEYGIGRRPDPRLHTAKRGRQLLERLPGLQPPHDRHVWRREQVHTGRPPTVDRNGDVKRQSDVEP